MKKVISIALMIVLLFMSNVHTVNGYVIWGYAFSNPNNVKFKVGSIIGQYSSMITTYAKKWNTCNEVNLSSTSNNENIYFYGELNVYNEAYAITEVGSNSNFKSVTLYRDFLELTVTEKRETIVHETGHCLGLDHCQHKKDNISVMREEDFNYKPYPLSDDKAGISAIY